MTGYRVSPHGEFETELEAVSEWADALSAARIERDGWIKGAHDQGYSLREIADAAGLSHAAIAKIVKR